MCGVGLIVVIYLGNLLKWHKPIPIAGIVFIAIMVSLNGKNPVQYSINRIIDTFIGIMVAVAVNYFVWPPDYLAKLRKKIPDLMANTKQSLYKTLMGDGKESVALNAKVVAEANELFELYCGDRRIYKRKNDQDFSNVQKTLDNLNQILQHLNIISLMDPPFNIAEVNLNYIRKNFGWTQVPQGKINGNEHETVFNYHLREVLNLYQSIAPIENKERS